MEVYPDKWETASYTYCMTVWYNVFSPFCRNITSIHKRIIAEISLSLIVFMCILPPKWTLADSFSSITTRLDRFPFSWSYFPSTKVDSVDFSTNHSVHFCASRLTSSMFRYATLSGTIGTGRCTFWKYELYCRLIIQINVNIQILYSLYCQIWARRTYMYILLYMYVQVKCVW